MRKIAGAVIAAGILLLGGGLCLYVAVNAVSRRKTARWDETDGVEFLRTIGLKEGDVVIDFGCGPGMFSVPAARLVGAKGMVYAVDRDARELRRTQCRATAQGLWNLQTATYLAEVRRLAPGRRCDMILLYDMLHFLDRSERLALYAALHGFLANDGLLSVHPTHVKDDDPARRFADITAENVAREITSSGYMFYRKIPVRIWHEHGTQKNVVWNFKLNLCASDGKGK